LNPRTAARFRILSTDFGRDGVLHVTRTSTGRKGMLLNNQYMLGGTAAMDAQRRQVLLPLILHPHPERVCCIGLATGISAGGALDHAPPCEVTAIEISAMVTASAARDFAEENRQVCQSRHADVIVEDARTYVASARDQFDVIVGDLFRPYGAGEGRLYSREHFAAVRAALRDGGLFCQWLPMYQLTADQFAIIARTFLSVFPEAELLRGNRESRPLLGLVGCRSGTIEFSHVDARCALLRQQQRISDKVLLSRSGIESLYLGRVDAGALPDAQINTLNNAVVELLAGRIRVTRDPRVAEVNRTPQSAYLIGQQWVAFERELQRYLMTAH